MAATSLLQESENGSRRLPRGSLIRSAARRSQRSGFGTRDNRSANRCSPPVRPRAQTDVQLGVACLDGVAVTLRALAAGALGGLLQE